MTAIDFRTLLSQNLDEVKAPVPLPAGTYKGIIIKFEFGGSREKNTPYLRYSVRPFEAGEDVDPELLNGIDLDKKVLSFDFWLSTDALYRVKEFWIALGMNTAGRSIRELAPEAVNAQVLLSVTVRDLPDGRIMNNVRDMKVLNAE